MLEWLMALGAAELGQAMFEQGLKLGQAAAEDYVKDFFKGCLREGLTATKPEISQKAVAEALRTFLHLFEDELEDQGITACVIRDRYDQPLSQFLKHETVKPILGYAFDKDCPTIDLATLAAVWQQSQFQQQPFPDLPPDFDWPRIGQEYLKGVRRIIRQMPELRSLLETELMEAIARNTAQGSTF